MAKQDRESPAERLRQFREMAAEARHSAAKATDPEMHAGYRQLAGAWDQLIKELESTESK
jgi:hypothetical protein